MGILGLIIVVYSSSQAANALGGRQVSRLADVQSSCMRQWSHPH